MLVFLDPSLHCIPLQGDDWEINPNTSSLTPSVSGRRIFNGITLLDPSLPYIPLKDDVIVDSMGCYSTIPSSSRPSISGRRIFNGITLLDPSLPYIPLKDDVIEDSMECYSDYTVLFEV